MRSPIQSAAMRAALFLAAVALSVPAVSADEATAQPAPKISAEVVPMAPAAPTIDWRTSDKLPDVDMTGLTDAQKATVLKVMREEPCVCGCGMKIAQCRVEDKACPRSPVLAKDLVAQAKAGKTDAELRASIKAAMPPPRPAAAAVPESSDPVDIPIKGAYSKGPADAKVTIVEFSDFQCPYCSKAIPWVDSVLAAYPKDVKLVFKHFPLGFHKEAGPAAEAALAAGEQGKFWQMHDKLFENYRTLSRANSEIWAAELGLNMEQFKKALDTGKFKAAVAQDMADGQKAGVGGTPSFFVNGRKYNGGRTVEAIKPMIDEALKGGPVVVKPAAVAPAPVPVPATAPMGGK